MWDILDTKLYAILSNPLYKSSSDSEGELKDVYKEFMETLILYLDTENDNRKRIRTLNITQVEFEMIKSLELSYGNKRDILKIVYSDKVLLLINKELELIYRQMQYPKYFINIETKWQSPLYLNPSVINYTDVMENICGLYYSNSINGIDGKNIPFSMLANGFELLFNFKFADIYKKRDEVLKRKPDKRTGFLSRISMAISQKSKENGFL